MNDWFDEFSIRTGGIPGDYLVLDIETIDWAKDTHITEVGYCLVRDCQMVSSGASYVNLAEAPLPADQIDDIASRMARTTLKMAQKGLTYCVDWATLCSDGLNPFVVFEQLADIIADSREQRVQIVGHGIWGFDASRIACNLARYIPGYDVAWDDNEILDSSAIVKGWQLGQSGLPRSNETLRGWSSRVQATRVKGLTHGLYNFCVPQFQLDEKHGLDLRLAHGAEFDCEVTHHTVEACRQLIVDPKYRVGSNM